MNWIKMIARLHETSEVIRLASSTGLDTFGVVGRLHRVWSWMGDNTTDGRLVGLTPETIDELVQTPGFGLAMVAVGWLAQDGSALVVPNFDRHNGETAKKRAQAAERQRRHREANKPPTTKRSARKPPAPEALRILPPLPPEKPLPKQDFRAESLQIVKAYADATGCYQPSEPAIQSVTLILRSEEIFPADLLAKVQAIGAEIARLPWRERKFSVSPHRFFEEGRWRADPATFSAGRTEEDEQPKREAWQIREELKSLDAEIRGVRDALSSWTMQDVYPDPEVPEYREARRTMTPAARAKLDLLTDKKTKLKAELETAK